MEDSYACIFVLFYSYSNPLQLALLSVTDKILFLFSLLQKIFIKE